MPLITRTILDALGRPIQTWIGTSDANAVKVESREYDGGGIGNGNVTRLPFTPAPGLTASL